VTIRPELWSGIEVPVDYKHRPCNGLRRLDHKMILKNSRMTNLGHEVLRFVETRRWTRRLPMRERIDPDRSPVRGNPNDHCGIENRECNYRKSFDVGLRGCHRSSVMIPKMAGFREQNYPEGGVSA
jgi:hypothetical protein